jgi:signal peptidase
MCVDVRVRVCSIVRYIGMLTIIMNDYPWVKFVLLGGMGLFVLTSKDAGA